MTTSDTAAVAGAQDALQFRAYVLDDGTRATVEQVIGELVIPNASVCKGGIKAAVEELGRTRSPRVLAVDLSGEELPLSAVAELAEVCEPGVTVIAVGDRNDVGLFRELLASGIADYLVKPINPGLLQRSLLSATEQRSGPRHTTRLGRLVPFLGTRGGVGVTTITANVASMIANRRGRRVAAVDLDLQFGSLALALDVEPSHGLREALENASRIDALYLERSMVRQSDTLHLLCAEEDLGDNLLLDPSSLDMILGELRSKFHYVLVDMPRAVTPCWHRMVELATHLVLVTDLSLAGMRDAARTLALMPAVNAACQCILVANRVGEHRKGEISREEFEKGAGRRIDLVLPFDRTGVAVAVNMGQTLPPESPVGRGIGALAQQLCGTPQAGSPSWWARLLPHRS
jgi:pilus assembly protein CpaE